MDKRRLAAIAPRMATNEEMQRFCLSDDRCYFFHAALHPGGLLALTVYHAEEAKKNKTFPFLTVYFSKADFINSQYVEAENKYRWFTSCLYRYFPYQCSKSLMDTDSKQALADFFGDDDDFFEVIERFQDDVLAVRLAKKHEKIITAIDKDMALVPALPKRFEEHIHTKAMPGRYIFYNYAKRKVLMGLCTNCRQYVAVEAPRHNKNGMCPKCNAAVLFKARGKISNGIWDEVNITLPQKIKGGFVLRFFETWRKESLDGKRDVGYHEYRRFLYLDGGIRRYIWGDFKQTRRMRWCLCTDGLHPYDGWIYPTQLDRMTKGTPWQYSSPYLYLQSAERSCIGWYLMKYLRHHCLENLLKNGFAKIVNDYMEQGRFGVNLDESKMRIHELLKISKQGLRIVQEAQVEPCHINVAQLLEAAGIYRYDAAFLAEIWDLWKSDAGRYIQYVLPYISHMKAMRYAGKIGQWKRRDWLDYEKMAVEVGYDMRKEHAIFPRNLPKAHETVTWLHREKVALASEGDFAPHVERLKAYEWKAKDAPYVVIAPRKATDIVNEGHRLNHCVHDYISRVIAGTCSIVFLRDTAKPMRPYVTMEIRDNTIWQYRGANNAPPNEATEAFVKEYQKWLDRRKPMQAAA